MVSDFYRYHTEYSIRRELEIDDPEDAAIVIEGKIYYADADEQYNLIGGLEGAVFSQINGISLWDTYDAAGAHVFEYYESYVLPYIEDERYAFMRLEGDEKNVEVPINTNVCALNIIGIIPEFRGKGLALEVMKEFFTTFGIDKCGAAILKPCPQTFDHQRFLGGKYDSFERLFETEKDGDTKRLERYYSRLGFKKLIDTELMFLNFDYHQGW